MSEPVWFWQRIVSPHMAGLAAALAATGRKVTYVAQQELSNERAAQGWRKPSLGMANLRLASTEDTLLRAVQEAPRGSIHICQGLRSNGLIGLAQQALAKRYLRQWVILETVDDDGWQGIVKRLEYRRLIKVWDHHLQGVLAIGHSTSRWLIGRGMRRNRVFPFAYFLPEASEPVTPLFDIGRPFRFLFVGQFIALKRVDMLFRALEVLVEREFELVLIGSGPLEETLQDLGERTIPGRLCWLGKQPIGEIPRLMATADCLVLPSRHDGWGAVVSEALMAGTPAICSDACGAAGAVVASKAGGVFPAASSKALVDLLSNALDRGRQTPDRRARLATWSRCLGAEAGASYLSSILDHMNHAQPRPTEPWLDG